MKYIDSYQANENKNIEQTKFDKNGDVTTLSNYYAEIIISGGNTNYFVKTYAGSLHDPFGPYSKRESTLDLKLKKVSQKTFNSYTEYLRTKNLKYLTSAQRGFIDDRT
jgi:hypothetical protein